MEKFDVMETTIARVHEAMRAGNVTVEKLISAYLDRIAAYDKKGPAINAVIMTNPLALEEAAELDFFIRKRANLPARCSASLSCLKTIFKHLI